MSIRKHGRTRLWALHDEQGALVALFAYKKGAQAVAARLSQAHADLHDMQRKLHDIEQRLHTAQEQLGAACQVCRCRRVEGALQEGVTLHPITALQGQKGRG